MRAMGRPRTPANIGRVFGMLTVVRNMRVKKYERTTWLCRCACGALKAIQAKQLLRGSTTSCGCKPRSAGRQSTTKLYRLWRTMRRRCSDPNAIHYGLYGGRGIRVCDRWQKSFLAFLE